MTREAEKWTMDALLRLGGWDVLHPEGTPYWETLGYDHVDIERVFEQARSGDTMVKAWSRIGEQALAKARRAEDRGFVMSAKRLYLRAALLLGRAQYSIYADSPLKVAYHAKMVKCFEKSVGMEHDRVERVKIPFDGKIVYGVLHLPQHVDTPMPAVMLMPGMDMIKEEWTRLSLQAFLPRGLATLAIDGPGQGETLMRGLKVTIDNYERAAQAAFEHLMQRPEIDEKRIGMLGVSMGSYWGTRFAAYEPRLAACATGLGCYGGKHIIFHQAQPNFRANFKYMSGIYDDEAFDRMAEQMVVSGEMAEKIKCPILFAHAEFDELDDLNETLEVYDHVKAPKEIWVFENQFHPLGGVADELYLSFVDWLEMNLAREPLARGTDQRLFVQIDGQAIEGEARPPWMIADRILADWE